MPYEKVIGHNRYIKYRRRLSKLLDEHPRLMEKLDLSYFNDRVLAKSVLKYRWPLGLLPQYQDDEEMVKEAVGVLSRRMKYHDEPEGVQYVQELSQIK